MKRIIPLLFVLILLDAVQLYAQNDSQNTSPVWGVKAQFDINIPGKWHVNDAAVTMYRPGAGFAAGPVCNIYLGKNFYLEPGLLLFYDTYSFKDLIISDAEGHSASNPSIYKFGFRIPVVAGYSIPINERFIISIYTGPEFSYAFSGSMRIKDSPLTEDIDLGLFSGVNSQHRADCGWKIGAGFSIDDNWMLSLDGTIGITDQLKSTASFRENRVTLGLTRYF